MQELLQMADRVGNAQGNVLILGASGTGKARLARYLHEKSGLGSESFVFVDCAAIPESLFESEMFGSVRGAYSDATVDRPGLVTRAEGGTLYFHHIEAFPLTLQSKILRFVADREYRPLGGSTTYQVKTRILASSVVDLPNLIQEGFFRHDLYFRLAVFTLVVPPLSARLEDLKSLIDEFSRDYPNLGDIPAALYAEILSYQWPGNVRELKNWVERSASSGSWLSPMGKKIDSVSLKLKDAVKLFKREFIQHVLALAEGNQTRAAHLLGINRTHLIKLLQESKQKKEKYDGKKVNSQ